MHSTVRQNCVDYMVRDSALYTLCNGVNVCCKLFFTLLNVRLNHLICCVCEYIVELKLLLVFMDEYSWGKWAKG